MSSRCINDEALRTTSDAGATLVMVTFLSIVFLAFLGLVTDAARLYLTKRHLQTAVDAAAVAGSRDLIMNPNLELEDVETRASNVAIENLKRLGYGNLDQLLGDANGQFLNVCFGEDGACGAYPTEDGVMGRYIRTETLLMVPTFLMGRLGSSDNAYVRAAAYIQNLKLRVGLCLDESGSMGTSFTSSYANCSGDQTRMCAVREAAKDFLDQLAPFDQAAVFGFDTNTTGLKSPVAMNGNVPYPDSPSHPNNMENLEFNHLANSRTLFDFTQIVDGDGNDNRAAMKAGISYLTPGAQTDIGSCIRRARQAFDALGATPPNTIDLLVVLTDGQPMNSDRTSILTWHGVGPSGEDQRPLTAGCNSDYFPDESNPSTGFLPYLDAVIESDNFRETGRLIYAVGVGFSSNPRPAAIGNVMYSSVLLDRIVNDQGMQLADEPRLINPITYPPIDPEYTRDFPCVKSGRDLSGPEGTVLYANDQDALDSAFQTIADTRFKYSQ